VTPDFTNSPLYDDAKAQARIAALIMALAVVQDTLEPILADRSHGFARVPAWAHARLTWLWGRTKAALAAAPEAAREEGA
jgi:hypothetical protein